MITFASCIRPDISRGRSNQATKEMGLEKWKSKHVGLEHPVDNQTRNVGFFGCF